MFAYLYKRDCETVFFTDEVAGEVYITCSPNRVRFLFQLAPGGRGGEANVIEWPFVAFDSVFHDDQPARARAIQFELRPRRRSCAEVQANQILVIYTVALP